MLFVNRAVRRRARASTNEDGTSCGAFEDGDENAGQYIGPHSRLRFSHRSTNTSSPPSEEARPPPTLRTRRTEHRVGDCARRRRDREGLWRRGAEGKIEAVPHS
jgi:hypothetical protein